MRTCQKYSIHHVAGDCQTIAMSLLVCCLMNSFFLEEVAQVPLQEQCGAVTYDYSPRYFLAEDLPMRQEEYTCQFPLNQFRYLHYYQNARFGPENVKKQLVNKESVGIRNVS